MAVWRETDESDSSFLGGDVYRRAAVRISLSFLVNLQAHVKER